MPTITINFPDDELLYKGIALPVADITAEGLNYLLVNGYRQALSDSVAGLGKRVKEEALKAGLDDEAATEKARDAIVARMVEKAEAIALGKADLRQRDDDDVPQSALEKARDAIVKDFITTTLLAGKTVPRASKNSTDADKAKIAEWWTRNIAGVYAKHNSDEDFDAQAREAVNSAKAKKASKVSLDSDLT
jgi:hypothetical protein